MGCGWSQARGILQISKLMTQAAQWKTLWHFGFGQQSLASQHVDNQGITEMPKMKYIVLTTPGCTSTNPLVLSFDAESTLMPCSMTQVVAGHLDSAETVQLI